MSASLFSENWYRVAELVPRLRSHAEFVKHSYREKTWYVAIDRSTGKSQRFTNQAYLIIQLMNGERNLETIWKKSCELLEDDMPTQDEVIALLRQLHTSGILISDQVPDIGDMHDRFIKEKRTKVLQYLKSPLSIKIPLFDPEKLLKKTERFVVPVYSIWGGMVWLSVVLYGAFLAVQNWDGLTNNFSDRVFAADSLLILIAIYPLIKFVHEFGHAYAIKRWGGEVHELGIMFLVFVPVPYVDASDTSIYANKYKRMLVGAAGIGVEVFLAALAMLFWVEVEPGFLRAVLFNIMLVGGVSTVLFNGNPLLRFDAYYVLSDWLEIPNLGAKSNKQVGHWVKKHILRIPDVEDVAQSKREFFWLFFYSIAAYIYRLFIMVTIAMFVAGKFFFIGVMLAMWSLSGTVIMPLKKLVTTVRRDVQIQRKKVLLLSWLWGSLASITILFFVIPFPLLTVAEGVLWVPEKKQIYAGADCFVEEILVPQKTQVIADQALIKCISPDLVKDVKITEAKLLEYKNRHRAVVLEDRNEGRILKDEILRTEQELAEIKTRYDKLIVKSPGDGKAFISRYKDLPGSYIRRGTLLGYVLSKEDSMIRAAVMQQDIAWVRKDVKKIDARRADRITEVLRAEIVREIPAATIQLPSLAISTEGGGDIVLDPSNKTTPTAFESLFLFDLVLPGFYSENIGERVYLRFHHSPEPLGFRIYRALRRLFLSRLSV